MFSGMLIRGAPLILGLLTTIYIGRHYGATDLGVWAYVISWITASVAFIKLGVDQFVINDLCVDISQCPKYFTSFMFVSAASLPVIFVLSLYFSGQNERNIATSTIVAVGSSLLLVSKGVSFLLIGMGMSNSALFYREGVLPVARSISILIAMALSIFFIEISVFEVLGLSLFTGFLFVGYVIYRNRGLFYLNGQVFSVFKLWSRGVYNFFSSIYSVLFPVLMSNILVAAGDFILLGRMYIYIRLFSLPNVVGQVSNTRYNKSLIKGIENRQRGKFLKIYLKIVGINVIFAFIFYVVLFYFFDSILKIWGIDSREDFWWCWVFAVGYFVNVATGPTLIVISRMKLQRHLWVSGLLGLFPIAVGLSCYDRVGGMALAVGLCSAYIVDNIFRLLLVIRAMRNYEWDGISLG